MCVCAFTFITLLYSENKQNNKNLNLILVVTTDNGKWPTKKKTSCAEKASNMVVETKNLLETLNHINIMFQKGYKRSQTNIISLCNQSPTKYINLVLHIFTL